MIPIKRVHQVNIDIEKRLIIALIMSDTVLNTLNSFIQPEVFELEVSKKVIKWIQSYYSKYKIAPKAHIKDLFESERDNIKSPILAEEIAQFLGQLSKDFENDNQEINEQFYIDRGKAFLEEKHLRKMANDVNALLDLNKPEEAKKVYERKKQIIQTTNYKWVKPFDDPQYMRQVFEELDTPLWRMRGNLGNLFGDFYAGWLMVVMGPMKRGKSYDLQDITLDALMSGLPTAFISLEMKDKHLSPRFYKHITTMGDEAGSFSYPCFDCCNNQDNTCNKPIRTNKESAPATFDPLNPTSYTVCTACRGKPPEDKDFLPTVWYFITERPKLTLSEVRKSTKDFGKHFGTNLLRMISFPAFSATMEDINDKLDELYLVEGFAPKVIVTDYMGIIASKERYNDPRHVIEEVCKDHKRMAQEREAFVITGAQSLGSSRAALSKDMQDESDIASNAQILSHLDILSVLDQTPDEKEKGIWRIGILEHRWKKFNKRRQIMALQQLDLGQPVLDTEIIYYGK